MVVRVTRVNKHEGWGFPSGNSGKEPACQCRRHRRCGFNPWVWKIPWRRAWQPTPVFCPGEAHGERSLEGYSPQGFKESDTAERLGTSCTQHKGQLPTACTCDPDVIWCYFCPKIQVELASKSMNALVIFQIPETGLSEEKKMQH